MRRFVNLFKFDASKALFVGVERECFLTDKDGKLKPFAEQLLSTRYSYWRSFGSGDELSDMPDPKSFGYELSACQVESRIGPCRLSNLRRHLANVEHELQQYVESYNGDLRLSYAEVGPEDMPLDVYPDPAGRYREISSKMPPEVLLAALRVIGTHIHIGMPDHETALKVYNEVIKKCDWLCSRGNGSFGERLDIYRIVAPECDPKPYADWADFYRVALAKGFDTDPRKCWTLIRISKHGTIEFRMFGATASLERIVDWAKLCHDLCKEAMV